MVAAPGLLTQLRRGALEFCVLALLRVEARYGFEIVKLLGEVDGMVTTEGTVYPLLSRLRRDGLVDTFWRESPSGPPRRYYQATREGLQALDAFASDWSRFRDSVDYFLATGGTRGRS